MKYFFLEIRLFPKKIKLNLNKIGENLSPIFVVGANRSGTSIITSIFSQHPELEGIFGNTKIEYDDSGHSIGFCESMHIWHELMPNPEIRKLNGHLPYWGLPKYISSAYKNQIKNNTEKRKLIWRLQRFRISNKRPLIKDQFNALRIGMISAVFPKSKFIFCYRRLDEFTTNSIHKWSNDKKNKTTKFEIPLASMHWHMLNLISLYELEIYFPGQYSIICLDEIQSSRETAKKTFEESLNILKLSPFQFDYSNLSKNWQSEENKKNKIKSVHEESLLGIREIIGFEKKIISKLTNQKF